MDFNAVSLEMDGHPFAHPSYRPLFEAFEKRLMGKKGEKALLFYTTAKGNFFRYGSLEGEELIYDPETLITLPVSEFVVGPEGSFKDMGIAFDAKVSVKKANIFSQRVEGLDHYPTLLGNYILGEERVDPRVYPRPSKLQVFIGDEEADKYFRKHEGMTLKPSGWLENFLKNGPGPDFLGALGLSEEELAASGDDL